MNLKHLLVVATVSSFSSYVAAVDVTFADSTWDGVKVPTGQQCQKFGGDHPATPSWSVTNIPAGSDSIVLAYSDRDSERMNNGGHGQMRFAIDNTSQVTIPSVAGHTFTLPAKFSMIEAHRGPGWDIEGAYMPPCSGGKGHAYYVTIKTMKNEVMTAQTVVEMGKF